MPGPRIRPTVLALAVALSAPALPTSFAPGLQSQSRGAAPGFLEAEVASVGVDLQSGAPLALLHSGWRELLPVWIGEVEAAAIIRGQRGDPFPRPLTHDLLVSVVRALGGTLEEVRVHDLVEGSYIGSLHVRMPGEERPREIDSRPSDALALAVRTGARILVATRLVEGAPDVDFVASQGAEPVVRMRGVTVREDRGPGTRGVTVLHVTREAEGGGLRVGDIIVRVADAGVESALEFLEALRGVPDRNAVPVQVLRSGRTVDLRIPPRRGEGRVG